MYYCVHADVIQLYLFHNGTIRQPPIQCFILLTFLKSRLLEKSLHMTDDFNSFLSVNPSLYYSSCSNMYYPRYKLPVVLANRQWQAEIHGPGNPIDQIGPGAKKLKIWDHFGPIGQLTVSCIYHGISWYLSVNIILKPQNPQNVRQLSNYARLSIIIITEK